MNGRTEFSGTNAFVETVFVQFSQEAAVFVRRRSTNSKGLFKTLVQNNNKNALLVTANDCVQSILKVPSE